MATLLIVVTGPITRQRQASAKRPKVATATLEEGWCVHLHRVADPRPIEIDARWQLNAIRPKLPPTRTTIIAETRPTTTAVLVPAKVWLKTSWP